MSYKTVLSVVPADREDCVVHDTISSSQSLVVITHWINTVQQVGVVSCYLCVKGALPRVEHVSGFMWLKKYYRNDSLSHIVSYCNTLVWNRKGEQWWDEINLIFTLAGFFLYLPVSYSVISIVASKCLLKWEARLNKISKFGSHCHY